MVRAVEALAIFGGLLAVGAVLSSFLAKKPGEVTPPGAPIGVTLEDSQPGDIPW